MKTNKVKAGLLSLLLLLLSAGIAAQQKQTTAQKFQATYKNTNPTNETIDYAYASSPDQTDVNVRATPGGTIVFKLDHNEPGYTVELYEVWNGWFRISPQIETVDQGPIVLKSKQAWIHGSQLGADTRNYGGEKLTFRTRPDANSPIALHRRGDRRLLRRHGQRVDQGEIHSREFSEIFRGMDRDRMALLQSCHHLSVTQNKPYCFLLQIK